MAKEAVSATAPVWHEKTMKVADLKPYEKNPRRISEKAFHDLLESVRSNGYHQRLICQPDGRIVGGHQRLKVFKKLGIKEIPVLMPDRVLTDEEFKRILVQDNLPFGEFDFEMLAAEYEPEQLVSYGMPPEWLNYIAEEETPATGSLPPEVRCPACGHEFLPRKERN